MERARAEHYNELRDVADVYSPLALRTLPRRHPLAAALAAVTRLSFRVLKSSFGPFPRRRTERTGVLLGSTREQVSLLGKN